VLQKLLGVSLAADSVRRITEAHGRTAVALDAAETADLLRQDGVARVVDRLQQVSADGVMVPLCGGTWEEARVLAVARIEQTEKGPHAAALSYFARLVDAQTFIAQSRLELARRHTADAREVVVVSDGATWLEGFAEENCPGAQRIIDWPHAVGYLHAAAAALYGSGSPDCTAWSKTWAGRLWAGEGEAVVAELGRLEAATGAEEVRSARHYLERRVDQMRYAAFRRCGYPTGSGIVESANKLVVEARLKGAGKHWQASNVNPMLALRCLAANERWDQEWKAIARAARPRPRRSRARPTRLRMHQEKAPPPPSPSIPQRSAPAKMVNGKPTRAHPWQAPITHRAKT